MARDAFITAREELYGFLRERYLAQDGPFCGKRELEGLYETNPLIQKAALFARDMGHVKYNRFGGLRLTGRGILYAEQEFSGD